MNFRKNANNRQRKADAVAIRAVVRSRELDAAVESYESQLDRHAQRAQRDKRLWAA